MKLEKLTRTCFGWCPGYESASRFIPARDVNDKAAGAAFIVVMLTIIFSPPSTAYSGSS